MKVLQYNCGCVKIDDTYIWLHFCEGDTDEFCFELRNDHICEGVPKTLDANTSHHIFWCLMSLVRDGERYRRIQSMLRDIVK